VPEQIVKFAVLGCCSQMNLADGVPQAVAFGVTGKVVVIVEN